MKQNSYMDRALRSNDPRFARVLGKLGYMGRVPQPDPLDVLRTEASAAGVKVDGRWGEERLRDEIATARKPKRTAQVDAEAKPKAKRTAKSVESDDGTKRKRNYKRRDMQAED